MDIKKFFEDAEPFLNLFYTFSKKIELKDKATADHICYKCDSMKEFESLRGMLEPESAYIYQSYIAGRRIAVIRLKAPFPSYLGDISFLELSDQKPDGSQISGFDHIEIFPAEGTIESLLAHLGDRNIKPHIVERPHHTTWDFPIHGTFKLRIEPEALIEKIKREEMK